MLRVICLLCLMTLPAFCEPAVKYEVGTITDVKLHQPGENNGSEVTSYDVSLKVADTIYVVLYTDALGTKTVKYAAGRELLVHVGNDTITYNDILGRSQEVPIIGQKPAPNARQSK